MEYIPSALMYVIIQSWIFQLLASRIVWFSPPWHSVLPIKSNAELTLELWWGKECISLWYWPLFRDKIVSRSPGGLISFGRLHTPVITMKGDMEPDSTLKLSSVSARIHQSSEQSLSLTPKGCIELLLWWGPHISAQAVHLCRTSPWFVLASVVCSWLVALPQALLVLSSNEDKKGQWSYSSTFLLSRGHPDSAGVLKLYCFSFSPKSFCAWFSCLQGLGFAKPVPLLVSTHFCVWNTSCRINILFVSPTLLTRLQKGELWSWCWMRGKCDEWLFPSSHSGKHSGLHGSRRVWTQLECCFLLIIHLVKSLFFLVCLSCNYVCSSYLHTH